MAKAINLRPNKARTWLAGDFNAKFAEGQRMAEERKHPTDKAVSKAPHITNDGTRV